MSEGIPYADIVILALIAGFILLRLRSVLGNKNDEDSSGYFSRPSTPASERQEPIVQLDEKSTKLKPPREEVDTYLLTLPGGAVADALSAIKAKDPQFTATRFLQGAKGAFEMVFEAFAKGDKATLKMLLSDTIFQEFSKEIDLRDKQENKQEITLVSLDAKEITEASLRGNNAVVTVHFISEQVMITRNDKGEIVGGDASEVHHVEDHWTFERDVTAKNPNWKIIET